MKTLFISISGISDLMKDEYTKGLVLRIRRPNPDKRAMIQAINSGDETLMSLVAKSLHASHTMLKKALTSRYMSVREYAAGNPSCREDLLALALESEDEPVKLAAARNTSLTTKLIDQILNGDYSVAVKCEAVKNPKATVQHINDALLSENEKLRHAAKVAMSGRIHKAERL